MDFDNYEMLLYILQFTEAYIEEQIYNVLSDSKEDPHYSAVTTTNLIKCYIQIMKQMNQKTPYSSVQEYFQQNGFSDEEFSIFENSRIKEAAYYVGKQF